MYPAGTDNSFKPLAHIKWLQLTVDRWRCMWQRRIYQFLLQTVQSVDVRRDRAALAGARHPWCRGGGSCSARVCYPQVISWLHDECQNYFPMIWWYAGCLLSELCWETPVTVHVGKGAKSLSLLSTEDNTSAVFVSAVDEEWDGIRLKAAFPIAGRSPPKWMPFSFWIHVLD